VKVSAILAPLDDGPTKTSSQGIGETQARNLSRPQDASQAAGAGRNLARPAA
jgi:hypothetical protein